MKTLRMASLVAIGIIFTLLLPDKEKERIRVQNQELESEIKLLKNKEIKNILFGGVTILPQDSSVIRLKGFDGIVAWYETPDFDELLKGNPVHFQRIGEPMRIEGSNVELKIPEGVSAIFKKNLSGHQYREEIDFVEKL